MPEEKVGMPQLDFATFPSQLIWLAITFLVLYFIVSRVVIPRTGGAIANRKSTIDGNLMAAQEMKDNADKEVAAYEAKLAEARGRADEIAHESYASLASEFAAERAKLDNALILMISDAEKRVSDAKNAALGEVQSVAAEIAQNIVAELTGAKVTKAQASEAVAKAAK
jgi:F-type H+-transporting ATPase subunit b